MSSVAVACQRSGRGGALWAVTAYFNPGRYRTRLSHYRLFRSRLPLPLLTVEWAHDGAFQLGDHEADRLVRVQGGDLMWQKERLLTIASQQLPDACEAVLLVDADIVLLQPSWPQRLWQQLQRFPVVQPFREVRHLPPGPGDGAEEPLREALSPPRLSSASAFYLARQSFAAHGLHGPQPTATPNATLNGTAAQQQEVQRLAARPSFGHAWAMRRDWLQGVGLYQHNVAGCADLAFAMALGGQAEAYCASYPLNPLQQAHYRSWAAAVARTAGPGRIGCLDGVALHLFHGHLQRRHYRSRLEVLAASGFDPARDLTAGPGQPFAWADSSACNGSLRRFFEGYFRSRAEDEASSCRPQPSEA